MRENAALHERIERINAVLDKSLNNSRAALRTNSADEGVKVKVNDLFRSKKSLAAADLRDARRQAPLCARHYRGDDAEV